FAGANVTAPHKEAVVRLCDETADEAVNTLVISDGRILGSNTDREIVAGLDATRVRLIGAGGAAKALLGALPRELPAVPRARAGPRDARSCPALAAPQYAPRRWDSSSSRPANLPGPRSSRSSRVSRQA